ncbi:ABC transporter permease [Sandaracinobacteroides saxicola]|uniref:ABC transporter permease n=1 Tax=Sandaracinobacteroides saxicola TaxID=2759707 RepID=A0A7G5IIT4_9SPHN|nr:ABC transporter permease [Sandaracinobacteroides saxicola]QMW23276.1 ABC transporter permease [Sandaracinobacteroides saxicola]
MTMTSTVHTAADKGPSLLRQVRALGPIALGNMRQAHWSSLTIFLCVMLVVIILNAFLGMSRGFAAASRSAGSETVAVLIGRQSQSEANSQISREQIELLAGAPGIVRGASGAILSPELTMTVSGRKIEDGARTNSTLRGLGPNGLALRDGFRITAGRSFTPGRYELIAGRRLTESVRNSRVGDQIMLAGRTWTVVGEYELASAVFEGEYLADIGAVQSAYNRDNQYQSIRARLDGTTGMATLKAFLAHDPRLDLDALTERALYHDQVKNTSNLIMYMGWPLAGILSIGALAGVFNTMLIVLEGRRHSLRVMRLLGFSNAAIVLASVMETILLALAGGVAGTLLVWLAANGAPATMIGSGFTTINYDLRIDALAFAQSLGLAAFLGLLGGSLPTLKSVFQRRA